MAAAWDLAGNAIAAGDFLGTTNAQALSVRTNGAERVHVQAEGNVGVGLNNPRTPLHVLGRMATGLDHTSAGALTFFPPDGFAWFHIDNGPARRRIGRLRFSHGPTPGSAELLTLVQDGNVGVGTAAPSVKLHVTGNRLRLESGGRRLDLRADGGALDVQSETHSVYVHSSGPGGRNHVIMQPFGGEGNVGIGTQTPTSKLHVSGDVRANDFLLTSDARLKEDVRPLSGALAKVQRLRGVEFSWRSGAQDSPALDARRQVGVVAQEVEDVAPELVDSAHDGYKGVDLSGLVGMLVEAVKDLAAENRTLRRRVEGLEQVAPGSGS